MFWLAWDLSQEQYVSGISGIQELKHVENTFSGWWFQIFSPLPGEIIQFD